MNNSRIFIFNRDESSNRDNVIGNNYISDASVIAIDDDRSEGHRIYSLLESSCGISGIGYCLPT